MPLWYAPPFLPVQVVHDYEHMSQQQQLQQYSHYPYQQALQQQAATGFGAGGGGAAGGHLMMLPAPGDQHQPGGVADVNQQALRYFADPGT
jgi:hypothetical protein